MELEVKYLLPETMSEKITSCSTLNLPDMVVTCFGVTCYFLAALITHAALLLGSTTVINKSYPFLITHNMKKTGISEFFLMV